MKIFVSNPPFISSFNRQVRWSAKTSGGLHPPIYLAYAAAMLAKKHKVMLRDSIAEKDDRAKFLLEIKRFGPDLIVMETSTPSVLNEKKLIKMIRKFIPKAKIALMGSHASAMPRETLLECRPDMVCIGEYDMTLFELAGAIEEGRSLAGIEGIAFRRGASVIINKRRGLIEDLDSLPWPMREALPTGAYSDTLLITPFTFVISGRGCPYYCTYCNWPSTMFGHNLRLRSPAKVVDEVEYRAVCEGLIKRKIKTPWICNARVDTLDLETMKFMRKAGCYLFKVGIESGVQETLDWARKGTTLEQARGFFSNAKKAGIRTFGSVIIGYPHDTRESIEQTFNFVKEIAPDMVQFVILQPLPGTELYVWMKKNGMLPAKSDWSDYLTDEGYVNIVFEHPNFSQDELREICSRLWKGYYMRPGYIARRAVRGIVSKEELKRNVKGVGKIFRYRT
jgi:radical SAM superfamily enzyme YgiQ (UPF0313 family)